MKKPDPIADALRKMHPADREQALKKLVTLPIAAAAKNVEKVAASTKNQVAELEAKVKSLSTQLAGTAKTLEIRKRQTPEELRDALNSMFDTYNFSPAEELVQMLKDPGHVHYVEDARLRANILMELQSYVMPKLKSTEIKGTVKHQHRITIVRIGEDGTRRDEQIAVRDVEAVVVPQIGSGRAEDKDV